MTYTTKQDNLTLILVGRQVNDYGANFKAKENLACSLDASRTGRRFWFVALLVRNHISTKLLPAINTPLSKPLPTLSIAGSPLTEAPTDAWLPLARQL